MIVSDTIPIINFGKQGVLYILKECFGKVITPRAVYEGINKKTNSPEALALEKAINEKWIEVEDVKVNFLLKSDSIEQGEKEAISLAIKKNTSLLIDDDSAKAYASVLGVETHGSFYVLYLACSKKIIDKKKAKIIFEGMIREGFYLFTELYLKFFELLEEIDDL